MNEKQNSKRPLVLVGVLFIVIVITVIMSTGGTALVDGHSMMPTLEDGDKMLYMNLFYTPKVSDIVLVNVVDVDDVDNDFLIKRVIGVAGDEIRFDEEKGLIYRNNVLLEVTEEADVLYEEGYSISSLTYNKKDLQETVTVPKGFVLVLGDNRENSFDSRNSELGMVHEGFIEGKAIVRVSPFGFVK
jgi:signal peptidase I